MKRNKFELNEDLVQEILTNSNTVKKCTRSNLPIYNIIFERVENYLKFSFVQNSLKTELAIFNFDVFNLTGKYKIENELWTKVLVGKMCENEDYCASYIDTQVAETVSTWREEQIENADDELKFARKKARNNVNEAKSFANEKPCEKAYDR